MVGLQDIGDTAVEAFYHPIGLWPSRGRQPMLDVVSCTRSVETVFAGGALVPLLETVGEFRTVVRETFPDPEGRGGDDRPEKISGFASGMLGRDGDVNPAGSPVDGDP